MTRSLHRSAHRDVIAAHNEGVLVGAGAVLRLMAERGPPGWARFYAACVAIEIEGEDGRMVRVPVGELLGDFLPAPRMAPSPEAQMEWIRAAVGSEAATAAAGPEQEKARGAVGPSGSGDAHG